MNTLTRKQLVSAVSVEFITQEIPQELGLAKCVVSFRCASEFQLAPEAKWNKTKQNMTLLKRSAHLFYQIYDNSTI